VALLTGVSELFPAGPTTELPTTGRVGD
jgi:hypothetical protein